MERREVIGLTGGVVLPITSGCLGENQEDTMADNCKSPIQDAVGTVSIVGESTDNLAIAANIQESRVEITIRNTTEDSSVYTESKELYDIQKKINGNWSSIFCVVSSRDWDRGMVEHKPRSGYQWNISTEGDYTDEREGIDLRESITDSNFRFIYFGLVEPELQGTDETDEKAISTQFSL